MVARFGMTPYEMRKQAVLSQWLQLQWWILPILGIPLVILLGARRTNGAIIVGSAATILIVVFRTFQDIANPITSDQGGYNSLTIVVIQIGGVALLAAWTLALAHAAQARRWRWFALMIIAGYLSYAIYYMSRLPSTIMCSFNLDSGDFSACLQPNIALVLMLALGQATGPVAMLIYALRAPGRAQRRLPEGLTVSSLHDKTWPGEDAVSAD